jgi:uncharacterized protein YecT (DUF1311 family)
VLHSIPRWPLGLLVLLFPAAAFTDVDTPGFTKAYVWPKHLCQNALELSFCLDSAYRKAEAHLVRTQLDIEQSLEEVGKKEEFAKLTKAWIEFSQMSCHFDAAGAGGNSANAIYAGCMFDYTVLRIRQLDKYAYCLRSDDCGQPVLLHLIISPVEY